MIDADGGGTLSKAEIVDAVKNNDEVIKFLSNCGNENLQSLLVPSRLEHALNCLDTDSDGEITAPEWEAAIEQALKAKIEQRRAAREAQAAADRRELEAFKEQFLNAAREVFALIDADNSGEITVHEMHAVVSDLLGLDLSVEDVFNVVQDIDEDGNGDISKTEFVGFMQFTLAMLHCNQALAEAPAPAS